MRNLIALGAAALMTLTPGWALAWRASNDLAVNPVTAGVFEVVGKPGSGAQDYWCAAGDYARRALNAAPNQRIYIARERARAVTMNRKSAVHFSLTPPAGADTRSGLSLTVNRVGENLGAAFAANYCYDLKVREF